MLYSEFLPSGRAISGATLGAVLLTIISDPGVGLASSCPSVADPQGINSSQPYQLDLAEYENQIGRKLALNENPLFADQVKSGALPAVAERVPEDALVYMPLHVIAEQYAYVNKKC